MAPLASMPALSLPQTDLAPYGSQWLKNGGALSRSKPYSSIQLGSFIDARVADALATMLGGIAVRKVSAQGASPLYPPEADCVERGDVAIVGGIRKQQFDVAYRPDGVRFAFDNKTLNDVESVGKNWQNMVNDLATEAATVHTRFPMAVVSFVVLIPEPALGTCLEPISWRLAGLGGRADEHGPDHVAEVMCLAIWDPATGHTSTALPNPGQHSKLRIEHFSAQIESSYRTRYAGAPPH